MITHALPLQLFCISLLALAGTKRVNNTSMEAPCMTGSFVGYELVHDCKRTGVYQVWSLQEFANLDLSVNLSQLARKISNSLIV